MPIATDVDNHSSDPHSADADAPPPVDTVKGTSGPSAPRSRFRWLGWLFALLALAVAGATFLHTRAVEDGLRREIRKAERNLEADIEEVDAIAYANHKAQDERIRRNLDAAVTDFDTLNEALGEVEQQVDYLTWLLEG
jgi:hypothetical protein